MMRSLAGQTLLVATGNQGKLAEFSALMRPFGAHLVSMQDLGLSEPEETATTFEGNVRIKARAGAEASGLPTLADDSGLIVEALGGAPGPFTADWAEAANGRDFLCAMRKVWALLETLRAPEPRLASFHCTLVLAWPDGAECSVVGEVKGQIIWPPRGQVGHGFDPVFRPEGQSLTFAEMTEASKNLISHRAVAVRALQEGCFT